MDLGWLAAIVAAISGAFVTIRVHYVTTRSAERQARTAAGLEDARRSEDLARERRSLERNAVLSLVTEFQAAHRYQQRFVFTAIPLRMDIPGHGSVTEVIETDKLEEAFPLWWEKRHDGLSVDVELITDAQVRETVRVCVNILDDAPEIAKVADQLDVQELVARASHTGFMSLGAWLREEVLPEDLRRQAAELRDIGDILWSSAT
ncbi:hypothetical protein [Curtobacterium flaccumfaciens]|uniref:hypothetical protein n=1 Tax=Curtobacterium flaccumfaciens TaxID=2035 RepID=UPI0005ACC1D5|nr:hypothetical protein [Curtobacterium flaccumfaciens]KIP98833.1 hypothetical protein RU06_17185 [Curtobacterium flaccumfaciens]